MTKQEFNQLEPGDLVTFTEGVFTQTFLVKERVSKDSYNFYHLSLSLDDHTYKALFDRYNNIYKPYSISNWFYEANTGPKLKKIG